MAQREVVIFNTEDEVTVVSFEVRPSRKGEDLGIVSLTSTTYTREEYTEEDVRELMEDLASEAEIAWFIDNPTSSWEDLVDELVDEFVVYRDIHSYEEDNGDYDTWEFSQGGQSYHNVPQGLRDLWNKYHLEDVVEGPIKEINDVLDILESSVSQEWGF